MKKSELLLVKSSMVEAVLGDLFARQAKMAEAQSQPIQQAGGMWEEMIAQFEALTAMRVEGGVAIIPLRGMVTPDDPFAALFGETNLTMFTKNVEKALADPKVKSIALNIYSPGGYVYGVETAANLIYEGRKEKPIYAYTDSLAASAAYWIASAATKVILGSETAEVGSIGVYLVHFDYSELMKKEGIKVTEITSGEFKGIGSPYSAMTPEEKKQLQADSSYVYTRFVNTVARNRGMEVSSVLKSANGLTFYGSDAVKAGLADSINSFQEVLAMSTTPNKPEVTEEATNQAIATERARAEKAEAQLKEFTDKAALAAAESAKIECNIAFKSAYGRDATEQEVSFYQGLNEAGRSIYKGNLSETRKNRDALVVKAGLTEEQVNGDPDKPESHADNNLVLQAARKLGFAVVKS